MQSFFLPCLEFCDGYKKSLYWSSYSKAELTKYDKLLEHPISYYVERPVQRLCRYPVLLRQLAQYDADPMLFEAFTVMSSIAKSASDAFKHSGIDVPKDIQGLDLPKDGPQNSLSLGNIKLLCEIKYKNIQMFACFFEQMLSLCKYEFSISKLPREANRLHIYHEVRYSRIKSLDLDRGREADSTMSLKLRLELEKKCFSLTFLSEDDASTAYSFLTDAKENRSAPRRRFEALPPDSGYNSAAVRFLDEYNLPRINYVFEEEFILSFDHFPLYCQHWISPSNGSARPPVVFVFCNSISCSLSPQFFKRQMHQENIVIFGYDIRNQGLSRGHGTVESCKDNPLVTSIENGTQIGRDTKGNVRRVSRGGAAKESSHPRNHSKDLLFVQKKLHQRYPGSKFVLGGCSYSSTVALRYLEENVDDVGFDGALLFAPYVNAYSQCPRLKRMIARFLLKTLFFNRKTLAKDLPSMSSHPLFQAGIASDPASHNEVYLSQWYDMFQVQDRIVFNTKTRFDKDLDIPFAFIESANDMTSWKECAPCLHEKFKDKAIAKRFTCPSALHHCLSDAGDGPFMDHIFNWMLYQLEDRH